MVKTGEIVYFYNKSNKHYCWNLNQFNKYKVINKAIDDTGLLFYAVEHENGTTSSWYLEEDFLTNIEIRKIKLNKIKNGSS